MREGRRSRRYGRDRSGHPLNRVRPMEHAPAAVMVAARAPLEVRAITVDEPRAGEVLVRIAASGVCHSDLHTLDGVHPFPLPVVLGHEGAGVVEAVGPEVTRVQPGDHVMLSWVP